MVVTSYSEVGIYDQKKTPRNISKYPGANNLKIVRKNIVISIKAKIKDTASFMFLVGNVKYPIIENAARPAVPIAAGTAISISMRCRVLVMIRILSCSNPLRTKVVRNTPQQSQNTPLAKVNAYPNLLPLKQRNGPMM